MPKRQMGERIGASPGGIAMDANRFDRGDGGGGSGSAFDPMPSSVVIARRMNVKFAGI